MSIIHMLRTHLSLRPWTPWVIISHDKRKKLLILTVFTWFLILDKIKDGDHVWWRQRPPAVPLPIKYTSSCGEDQRLTTEGSATYRNLKEGGGGGGSINPPPPSVHVGGLIKKWTWLCQTHFSVWTGPQISLNRTIFPTLVTFVCNGNSIQRN